MVPLAPPNLLHSLSFVVFLALRQRPMPLPPRQFPAVGSAAPRRRHPALRLVPRYLPATPLFSAPFPKEDTWPLFHRAAAIPAGGGPPTPPRRRPFLQRLAARRAALPRTAFLYLTDAFQLYLFPSCLPPHPTAAQRRRRLCKRRRLPHPHPCPLGTLFSPPPHTHTAPLRLRN